LVQLAMPSRATDVDDVLLNTLGAALGAVFIVRSRR
jgi:glycopeptide antibiotics resistance protein